MPVLCKEAWRVHPFVVVHRQQEIGMRHRKVRPKIERMPVEFLRGLVISSLDKSIGKIVRCFRVVRAKVEGLAITRHPLVESPHANTKPANREMDLSLAGTQT
jgi:hypothetical protein